MTLPLELNPLTRSLEETPKFLIFPIASLEEDRIISWGRPYWLENSPTGAVLPVGSYSGASDQEGVVQATRNLYVGCAEGGIVGWGQFPNASAADRMIYQAVCMDEGEGIAGIPTLSTTGKIEGLTIADGELQWDSLDQQGRWEEFLAQITIDYYNENWQNYGFPVEAAPGFYQLLAELPTLIKHQPWAIKLQLAAPATTANSIIDKDGVKAKESLELVGVIQMLAALRNRWMTEKIRESWRGRIILCSDNPITANLTPDEFIQDAKVAFSLVEGMDNLLLMEHCCSPLQNITVLEKSGLNGSHLDVFNYPEQIVAHREALANFLIEDGHFLALGIVPTDFFGKFAEDLARAAGETIRGQVISDEQAVGVVTKHYQKALEALHNKLKCLVDHLLKTEKFEGENEIWAKIMVSSSCGQGTLNPAVAETIFYLMRDLSQKVRFEELGRYRGY